MTSEGLGEMFEGAGKFPLVSMGAERRVSRAQTRERGPPSALAEILTFTIKRCWSNIDEENLFIDSSQI